MHLININLLLVIYDHDHCKHVKFTVNINSFQQMTFKI